MSAPEEHLYLDLLKQCLTRSLFPETYRALSPTGSWTRSTLYSKVSQLLERNQLALVRRVPFDPTARAEGRDWPPEAETMIGARRLDNLQSCVTDVVRREIPGDLIEAGVWRGGATILMRAVLKAFGDTQRCVWVADSFQGVPYRDPSYPADRDDRLAGQLAVSLDEVKANFRRYGLLDDQVKFLLGWFRDTLPDARIEHLALMRLDGDLYESTIIGLRSLYPKLSPAGYVIVDDYWEHEKTGASVAVDDFRSEQGITTPLERVDWASVFWQKQA
jgi:O-methyltransferase